MFKQVLSADCTDPDTLREMLIDALEVLSCLHLTRRSTEI